MSWMELIADSSGRIDAFLASKTPLSRSRVRRAIDMELVTVNGVAELKPARKVKEGDTVEIDIDAIPVEGSEIKPVDLSLEVLYEDDSCMVINKPAGFAVHPGTGMPEDEVTILHGVAFVFKKKKIPFSTETILVHRLDKDTTGCLLIAKTAAAHRGLQEQFSVRSVSKTYLALVAGIPNPPAAMIDSPIGRNLTDRTKMSVMKTSVSREAQTTYTTIDTGADAALLACELHTGRTHQIRVHLSSIGYPVLGDKTYASSKSKDLAAKHRIETLCLHAWKLGWQSPTKGKKEVQAPIPETLATVLKGLNIAAPITL